MGSWLAGLIRLADFYARFDVMFFYLMCLIGMVGGVGDQFHVAVKHGEWGVALF